MTMLPRWAALIDRLKDRGQLPMGKGKSPGKTAKWKRQRQRAGSIALLPTVTIIAVRRCW